MIWLMPLSSCPGLVCTFGLSLGPLLPEELILWWVSSLILSKPASTTYKYRTGGRGHVKLSTHRTRLSQVSRLFLPLSRSSSLVRLVGSNSSSWGWCLKTMKVYHDSRKYRHGVPYPRLTNVFDHLVKYLWGPGEFCSISRGGEEGGQTDVKICWTLSVNCLTGITTRSGQLQYWRQIRYVSQYLILTL